MKDFKQLIIFISISACMFSSCGRNSPKDDNNVVISDNTNEIQAEETKPENKSEINEIVKEVVPVVVDLTKTVIKNIKINDSIKMANREQMFAYQLGLPIRHEEELFEAYHKLSNTESIYVLELRKEYYLIKYEGKSKSELETELDNVKEELSANVTGAIKVKNLMDLCSKREKLIVGDNITRRKEEIELPCLICK